MGSTWRKARTALGLNLCVTALRTSDDDGDENSRRFSDADTTATASSPASLGLDYRALPPIAPNPTAPGLRISKSGSRSSKVCSERYSRLTCVLLGIVVELSMIVSDMTKTLSVAYGFTVLFELDLFSCTFLASIVSAVLPIVFSFLGSYKLIMLQLSITFTLMFYVPGVYLSQSEASFQGDNTYSGVSLKNVSMIMSLLSANIIPHNLYIHPCIVQQPRRQLNASMSAVILTHLFAIVLIFTSIFLVNIVMMNTEVSVFSSQGFFVPSFEDGVLFMDQAFRSPAVVFPFCFFLSSAVVAITHSSIGQGISLDFFDVNLPIWVYHTIAKVFAVAPALYFTKGISSEGIYELLLFCQITLAILLPPSLIPLLQVSSSRLIMGAFRISFLVEFLCMITFMVMLSANGIFITELLFEDSEWSVDSRGDVGNDFTLLYTFTILLALASLLFTLYLFFTPLRSSKNEPYMKMCTMDLQKEQTEVSQSTEESFSVENLDNKYPETDVHFEQGSHSFVPNTAIAYTSCMIESIMDEVFSGTNKSNVVVDDKLISPEPLGFVYGSKKSLVGDKSLSDVSVKDKASGLSRGEKRQLAAILEEFWGLLFDYYGKLTKEANNMRAALLLDLDIEPPTSTISKDTRVESSQMESAAEMHPVASTGSCPNNSLPVTPAVQYRGWQLTIHETEPVPLTFSNDSTSNCHEDEVSQPIQLILGYESFWTKSYFIPYVNYTSQDESIYTPAVDLTWGGKRIYSLSGAPKRCLTYGESERLVLQSLRFCIRKLLRLDKSDWLFNQNGGPDEELMYYLAMAERILHKDGPSEVDQNPIFILPSISYCSKRCIWKAGLVSSFGVWCVRRILELLLEENRPELWGRYTYVLNRLQGILDPAFCKPREIISPCKCLQASCYSRENPGKAQVTSRRCILDLIKKIETSIMKRKGPQGTKAADVAYSKGRKTVASVCKRYKRKLSSLSH